MTPRQKCLHWTEYHVSKERWENREELKPLCHSPNHGPLCKEIELTKEGSYQVPPYYVCLKRPMLTRSMEEKDELQDSTPDARKLDTNHPIDMKIIQVALLDMHMGLLLPVPGPTRSPFVKKMTFFDVQTIVSKTRLKSHGSSITHSTTLPQSHLTLWS